MIEQHGPQYLHRLLHRLDRESAKRIAPADTQKIIRAVEVCVLARKPLTQLHSEGRNPLQGWQIIKVGLEPNREELYASIHARIDNMLATGWQTEVTTLLSLDTDPTTSTAPPPGPHPTTGADPITGTCSAGRSPAAFSAPQSPTGPTHSTDSPDQRPTTKPLDFLGYKELAAVTRNEMSLPDARAAIQQSTRRYAKRQQTWFRREQNVKWFQGFGHTPSTQQAILNCSSPPPL